MSTVAILSCAWAIAAACTIQSVSPGPSSGADANAPRHVAAAPPRHDVKRSENRTDSDPIEFFTDAEDFRIAAEAAGLVMTCKETFEEGDIPPNSVIGFDDPLAGGVPCRPPGCPFPDGLVCLDLTVQSRTAEGVPRGRLGLAAANASFLPIEKDIVLANYFVDGLDLVFTDECCKRAVAGNTLSHDRSPVTITVYDSAGLELGGREFPANLEGTHFMGAVSDGLCIGRVNVFSAARGAEGLDNIQMWCRGAPPPDACKYTRRVKAKGGCQSCPPRVGECVLDGDAQCVHIEDCRKKIRQNQACPNGPGSCKITLKRCDCH